MVKARAIYKEMTIVCGGMCGCNVLFLKMSFLGFVVVVVVVPVFSVTRRMHTVKAS